MNNNRENKQNKHSTTHQAQRIKQTSQHNRGTKTQTHRTTTRIPKHRNNNKNIKKQPQTS